MKNVEKPADHENTLGDVVENPWDSVPGGFDYDPRDQTPALETGEQVTPIGRVDLDGWDCIYYTGQSQDYPST